MYYLSVMYLTVYVDQESECSSAGSLAWDLLWFEYLIPGAQICLLHSRHESMKVARKKTNDLFFFNKELRFFCFLGFFCLFLVVPFSM